MGKIELDHTGSGGGITLSSDGTDLLLDGTAIGGGGGGTPDLYAENYDGTSTAPSATGTNAVAIGLGAVSSGLRSVAIGNLANASSLRGFAVGVNSAASGSNAISMGANSASSGSASVAIGTESSAASDNSFALGYQAKTVTGSQATAVGYKAYASGTNSFAAATGDTTSAYGATGQESVAIGKQAKATGLGSLAISANRFGPATSTSNGAVAIGDSVTASGSLSLAMGYNTTASASSAIAIGSGITNSTANQVVLGGTAQQVKISDTYTLPTTDGTNGQVLTTDGSGAVTFADAGGGGGTPDLYADNYDGTSTKPSATGTNAFAIGVGAISSGSLSIALGTSNAYGIESFAAAIDHNSTTYGAGGSQGIAIGRISRAHGNQAIAIGSSANCSGNDAICIGESSQSSQRYSSILGNSSSVSSYGGSSIGYGNTINSGANSSVALGAENKNNSVAGKLTYAATNTLGSGEPAGSPKTGIQVIVAHTADATATVATTPTSSGQATASSDTIPALPNNSAYAFSGTIVARQQASQGTASAAWKVEGLIRREGSAGTTVLVNSATTVLDNTPGWGMALSADTTNGGLAITVTGAASTNIRWVATIHTSEVTYA